MGSPSHTPIGDPCTICRKPACSHRVSHAPWGDTCRKCGLPSSKHRVKHQPDGDPCSCGVPMANHSKRTRSASEIEERRFRSRTKEDSPRYYVGLDGEGQGRRNHKYVLLAASDKTGRHQWYVENLEGLSTIECFEFLLALPHARTKFFGYGFNYDISKIIEDIDNERIYVLMRPEHPKRRRRWEERKKGPKYVRWKGYDINLQASKLTIRKGKQKIVIWDVLKFYQTTFVKALKTWGTGDPERLASMEYMKAHRSEFDKMPHAAVRTYCLDECAYLAEQAEKLTEAHEKAGLHLVSYYGAGSTSSAMLKAMDIESQIVPTPKYMERAVAMAFFGGRFEHSVIGEEYGEPWLNPDTNELEKVLWAFDLSSAYPYQMYFLPCLKHATWDWVTARKDLYGVEHALVEYTLPVSGFRSRTKNVVEMYQPWGPFPFRSDDGSIAFPSSSGGGYVWLQEFLEAEKLYHNVQFKGAWVHRTDCDCHPFKDVAKYYLERLRIDKDGPGIVIKLGLNGGYGKLAQSVGAAPFNCWIWASMITSGCRAQVLQASGCYRDRSNLLLVATDGIAGREWVNLPRPMDTGTDVNVTTLKGEVVRKPLGGWEPKKLDKGLFLARPGIYFPLSFSEDKTIREKEIDKVRGRGVGRKVLFESYQAVIDAWRENPSASNTAVIKNVDRFCGAMSSITYSKGQGYKRANGDPMQGEMSYGQWISRPVTMSFDPMPKRECLLPDGRSLKVRALPVNKTSMPYKRALKDSESIAMMAYQQMMLEQPDGDFAEDYAFE